MIAIIDYGAGNLHSVQNAIDYIGAKSIITSNKQDIIDCDKIILPGVGAFPKAMEMLNSTDLIDTIKEQVKEKPLLGICLGMQMLFDYSTEFEKTQGLSLIEGYIDIIDTTNKIPHIGFNQLENNIHSKLVDEQAQNWVYFVHSYMAYTSGENVVAYCDYGVKIPALVQKGNVYGAQFHPEKSGEHGIEIVKRFIEKA